MDFEVVCEANDDRWLEERRKLLTASDVSAVLGINPWTSPLRLWQRKLGLAPPEQDSEQFTWAREAEPFVAQAYARRTGRPTQIAQQLLRSVRWPWLGATLDAWTVHPVHGSIPLEIKWTRSSKANEDWAEGVPELYAPQLETQARVAGTEAASAAASIFGAPIVWCDRENDRELWTRILDATRDFVKRIENEDPPKPQAGDGNAVRTLHPAETPGSATALPIEAVEIHDRLVELKRQRSLVGDEIDLLSRELELMIGDHETGLLPGGGSYTWKTVSRAGYMVQPSRSRQLRYKKR
jgi:putative phage-type endonuclease